MVMYFRAADLFLVNVKQWNKILSHHLHFDEFLNGRLDFIIFQEYSDKKQNN